MFFPVSGIECHPLVPVLAAMGISFVTSMGGLSGAFLLLPFQMSFLGYTSPGVSATNHLFNVLACPGGIVRYAREGRLLWPLALTVAVGTLPGIVLGSLIRVYWLPDESRFKVFAGLLLLWIFWRMFRDLRRPAAPARKGGGMARIHVERWDRSRLVFTFGEARHSVSCPRLAALSLGIGRAASTASAAAPSFPPSWSASSACPSMPSPGPCCWAPSWPRWPECWAMASWACSPRWTASAPIPCWACCWAWAGSWAAIWGRAASASCPRAASSGGWP
jgi:uncharacterized membrane protein YfcA